MIRGFRLAKRGLVPAFTYSDRNIYAYNRVDGHNMYQNFTNKKFEDFLKWYEANFVYTAKTCKENQEEHIKDCRKFYQNKTYQRVKQFLDTKPEHYYLKHKINGLDCHSISEILLLLDWDKLCDGTPIEFHGDLNFGNVLYDGKKFYAIDWREYFGNDKFVGDLYYDLGKLYAGLCLSWDELKDENKISMNINNREVNFSLDRIGLLAQTRQNLVNWCRLKHYNIDKIKTIASLSYLNMAPLHTEKLGNLLFFKSVYNLSKLV